MFTRNKLRLIQSITWTVQCVSNFDRFVSIVYCTRHSLELSWWNWTNIQTIWNELIVNKFQFESFQVQIFSRCSRSFRFHSNFYAGLSGFQRETLHKTKEIGNLTVKQLIKMRSIWHAQGEGVTFSLHRTFISDFESTSRIYLFVFTNINCQRTGWWTWKL